jgi:hypothetical protein
MKDFEAIARKFYEPLAEKYNLQFAALDGDEFFLIGKGYAFWIFVDPRDGADVWYVSIDHSGNPQTHTLMYLKVERFTDEDSAVYGKPVTMGEIMIAGLRADAAWLMNRCQDLLTGDKTWLKGYKDQGDYSRHVARFLKPYFEKQGYYIAPVPDSYRS